MGVSKNRGTPKSSILIWFSIINHPFWGTLIFGNTHIFRVNTLYLSSCYAKDLGIDHPSVLCPVFLGTADVNGFFCGNPHHFPLKKVWFFKKISKLKKKSEVILLTGEKFLQIPSSQKTNIYHRENRGTLGMVPLIINPIYTLYSGYLLGIFPMNLCLPRSQQQQATSPLRSPSPTLPVLMTWTSGSSDPSSSKRASPGKTSGVITWRIFFWVFAPRWVGFLESKLRTCFFFGGTKKKKVTKKFVKIEADDIFQVHLQKSEKPSGEIHWNPGKVWFHLKVLRANQAYITLGYKKKVPYLTWSCKNKTSGLLQHPFCPYLLLLVTGDCYNMTAEAGGGSGSSRRSKSWLYEQQQEDQRQGQVFCRGPVPLQPYRFRKKKTPKKGDPNSL